MSVELSATKFKKKWGKPSHSFFHFGVGAKIFDFCVVTGYCVLYLCYQYMYDRMYEQTVMLLGTAGRLVSHIMLRLMQLTKRRLYFLMTLTGETYKGSAQIPGVSLCGGTPA